MASSLLGVLVIGSIIDYELITVFQLADGLNALACMTALTTIYAVSRGMIPDENMVYDPEWSIMQVIQHIHYMPDHWKENLHSDEVLKIQYSVMLMLMCLGQTRLPHTLQAQAHLIL